MTGWHVCQHCERRARLRHRLARWCADRACDLQWWAHHHAGNACVACRGRHIWRRR